MAPLSAHRHLRGARVLCIEDGARASRRFLRGRRRGCRTTGSILRHSFCSHLAMRGAAIQELAARAS